MKRDYRIVNAQLQLAELLRICQDQRHSGADCDGTRVCQCVKREGMTGGEFSVLQERKNVICYQHSEFQLQGGSGYAGRERFEIS